VKSNVCQLKTHSIPLNVDLVVGSDGHYGSPIMTMNFFGFWEVSQNQPMITLTKLLLVSSRGLSGFYLVILVTVRLAKSYLSFSSFLAGQFFNPHATDFPCEVYQKDGRTHALSTSINTDNRTEFSPAGGDDGDNADDNDDAGSDQDFGG